MKNGFTLAETLVTLGIIAVIAAITIPVFIKKYQQKQFLTMAKVNYNIINNALEHAKVEYGTDVNNWYYSSSISNRSSSIDFAERYMVPYLNVVKFCRDEVSYPDCNIQEIFSENRDRGTFFVLSNSAIINVFVGELYSSNIRVRIAYDINGAKKPNQLGKDIFLVELGGSSGSEVVGKDKNRFLPYAYVRSRKCSDYISDDYAGTTHACKKGSGRTVCLAYIVCNGWEIPEDYPW